MAVKNFFSGVESTQHFKAAMLAGVEHMLMSYLYITKQPGNALEDRKRNYPKLQFLIDSGAHTLQLSANKAPYNTWKLADYEKYARAYADWLRKNKQFIFAAVELDIASALNRCSGKDESDPYGDSIVGDWRKNIFQPLQNEGLNICYVWHKSQGLQGWEDLCANFAYVGLPGEMSKQDDFGTFMAVARRYTTKVHGFAATKQSDFRDHPWFSIDSTTWKAGEIYGTLPVWDERHQRLRFMSKDDNRAAYRQVFYDWGLNADKVINDSDYQEVTRASLKSMTMMEHFYAEKYASKVFFYDLRLPAPACIKTEFPLPKVKAAWDRFSPVNVFPQHAGVTNLAKLQEMLLAISCVQYRELNKLTQGGRQFLEVYFKEQMGQATPDALRLAKEMAMMITPGNEPAQRRETEEDYADTNNPPRQRSDKDKAILFLDEELPTHLLLEMERLEQEAPSWLNEDFLALETKPSLALKP